MTLALSSCVPLFVTFLKVKSFKSVSKKFEHCFMGVSIQVSFKDNCKVFRGIFKGVRIRMVKTI